MLHAVRTIIQLLSSILSKVLERFLLLKYENVFFSNQLQFGFKPGYPTMLRTGMIKNVISRYIHNGSAVLGFFLDARKQNSMNVLPPTTGPFM